MELNAMARGGGHDLGPGKSILTRDLPMMLTPKPTHRSHACWCWCWTSDQVRGPESTWGRRMNWVIIPGFFRFVQWAKTGAAVEPVHG